MTRLLANIAVLGAAFGAGVIAYDIRNPRLAQASGVLSTSAGPTGSNGATGPTGPAWTTCAALAASISGAESTGTCGSVVLSSSPTLTTPNIGAATGTSLIVSGNIAATGTLGVTGTATFAGAVTIAPASGVPLTLTPAAGLTGLTITDSASGTVPLLFSSTTVAFAPAIKGQTTAGYGLNGTATTSGSGVLANCSTNNMTGYCLEVNPDTTSPVQAAVKWAPQNANPTGAALVGDLYMFTGGTLRVATATTPTWNDVGSFRTVAAGLTAFAGGGQGSATAVCAVGNVSTVTTVTSTNDSLVLPASPVLGQLCTIKNKGGAKSAALFPGSGDSICLGGAACLSANTSIDLIPNSTVDCWAESLATWHCRSQLATAGTTTNDSAGVGYVGEYFSSALPVASAVTGATTVVVNIANVALTPGDWDVTGICCLDTNITGTVFACGLNTTSATMPAASARGDSWVQTPTVSTTASDSCVSVPAFRASISSNTTHYLVSSCTDSGGTCTMYGRISARRVR